MTSEIEINVQVIDRTPLALLVTDGHKEAWVPLSQILDTVEETDGLLAVSITAIVIPRWLADAKGLRQHQLDDDTMDMFGAPV